MLKDGCFKTSRKSIHGHCGRGSGVLAQVNGRSATPFMRKIIVPAAIRVGADLLEFAVSENADVVSCRKSFKTPTKSVGRQTLKIQLGSGSGKKSASRVFPTINSMQPSRSPKDIFTNISP